MCNHVSLSHGFGYQGYVRIHLFKSVVLEPHACFSDPFQAALTHVLNELVGIVLVKSEFYDISDSCSLILDFVDSQEHPCLIVNHS